MVIETQEEEDPTYELQPGWDDNEAADLDQLDNQAWLADRPDIILSNIDTVESPQILSNQNDCFPLAATPCGSNPVVAPSFSENPVAAPSWSRNPVAAPFNCRNPVAAPSWSSNPVAAPS